MAEATDAKEMVEGLATGAEATAGAAVDLFSFSTEAGAEVDSAAAVTGLDSAEAEVEVEVFSEGLFIVMMTASESDSSSIVTSYLISSSLFGENRNDLHLRRSIPA